MGWYERCNKLEKQAEAPGHPGVCAIWLFHSSRNQTIKKRS